MRQMSFALTTRQIRERIKFVTRRIGWADLKPGTELQAIEKGQGLGKGGKVVKLCVIRVVDVRRERLDELVNPERPGYGESEMILEGLAGEAPQDFILRFVDKIDPDQLITRVQFEYR